MKPLNQHRIKPILLGIAFLISSFFSYGQNNEDKTLSPYFLIKSADETMDQLPLKVPKQM